MEIVDQINQYLKKELSEKRYNHCVRTMERAEELAQIYGVDTQKARICGLAHDIAKEMTPEESLEYIKNNKIRIDKIERKNTKLLHGKIGADIAKKQFGLSEDMQKAIEYHTTTNPQMDKLAKIIFVADKTERGRTSTKHDLEYERKLSEEDLDGAVLYIIEESIKGLIEKNNVIHPKSIQTRNQILLNKKEK